MAVNVTTNIFVTIFHIEESLYSHSLSYAMYNDINSSFFNSFICTSMHIFIIIISFKPSIFNYQGSIFRY